MEVHRHIECVNTAFPISDTVQDLHMRLFIHTLESDTCSHSLDALQQVIHRVAETSDTRDLVVSLYLAPNPRLHRGTAYVQTWLHPRDYGSAAHSLPGFW